jgi:hypothetical protein
MDRKPGNRLRRLAGIIAGALLAIPVLYVLGYFAASKIVEGPQLLRGRVFLEQWKCMLYAPAVRIEAAARGEILFLYYTDHGKGYHVYDYYPHHEKPADG